ncbi:BRO-N domain-containing protein [Tardiphaga sp. 839_C3_N1_4]|uniref:BRO-N domain-containing protein n=1 Tax=Tardiphaga sp. 839_C3_N1_4 TaxID=3240761 RepID=UPI003F248AC8
MQYELQIFQYESEFQFRTMDINGENWFVLADACRALDIKNASDAAKRLDEDEKGIAPADTLRGTQSMLIINESGLFSLILRSDKPQAKRFKKWVTSEVLPSIRRTGSYIGTSVPAFINRFNQNWDRVEVGYFSVLSELAIRIWGRFEQVGYRMKESTAAGVELRPDISVGMRFAEWLRKNHPKEASRFKEYSHWTPAGEFPARQYENKLWPLFIQFVDTVWLAEAAPRYFKTRDPSALEYLPKLLPAPMKKAS